MRHHRSAARYAVGVLVVGSLALTTACGAGSQTGAATAKKVGCDITQPTKSTTVNVLAYNSSAIDPFTNTMIASCKSDTLTLRHDPIDFGGQVQKTAATLNSATGNYDIVEGYSLVVPQYADKLEPLDSYFAKYKDKFKLGDLDKTMLEGMSYNGHLYGIPTQANVTTFAYRKDIFKELGLQPPKDFAELKAAAARIQASGKMKYPLALPLLASGDISTRYMIGMFSQGKSYVDAAGKPTFTTPDGTNALKGLKDLTPYMDPQVTTFDQPKVQQQLFNGTAAIGEMYSGRMLDLTQQKNTKFYDQFGFITPPSLEPGGKPWATLSVDGWTIPKNTKVDKDLLFQIMAASVSKAVATASVPGAYPSRTGIANASNMAWFDAVNGTLAAGTRTPPMQTWTADLQTQTRAFLAQGVTGQLPVQDALSKAQAAAAKVLAAAGS